LLRQVSELNVDQGLIILGAGTMGCEPSICTDAAVRSPQIDTNREAVVLLHGSAGTGALWRATKSALRPFYLCIAPDLIGYGASAAWPTDASFDLDAELRAIEPLLQCCAGTFHLVGYSYGGVLALHLALANPRRVHSLTLIEPVFFAALKYADDWTSYFQFCRLRDEFVSTLAEGDCEAAMRRFVDFWMGDDAWTRLAAETRLNMLKAADKIVLDWQASFAADPGRARLSALAVRTMLVRGGDSPSPMCSLVDALHAIMPGSERIVVEGANHLLPLTHASALTSAILSNLHAAERRLR
jgi:pimeloyl-ACP methyl ester carboxylesterase